MDVNVFCALSVAWFACYYKFGLIRVNFEEVDVIVTFQEFIIIVQVGL